MLHIDIPGRPPLKLDHLVLDYNGTLAQDGSVGDAIKDRLRELAKSLTVHVITADTHGNVRQELSGLPASIDVIKTGAEHGPEDQAKTAFVQSLGEASCVAVGNGRNDLHMLRTAALGVAVIQAEGAFPGVLAAADIVTTDIANALDLLLKPKRLIATLRN